MDISTSIGLAWCLLSYIIVISWLIDDFNEGMVDVTRVFNQLGWGERVVFFIMLFLFIVFSPITAIYCIYKKVRGDV